MINDLEASMGNTELRLSLASIESEVVEVKSIALESLEQCKKTNGRVSLHDKMLWTALGALAILTPLATWFTLDYMSFKEDASTSITPAMQAAIQTAVMTGLLNYEVNP